MCISPVMIKNEDFIEFRKFSHHSVPCGKCYECRMNRGAGWAFRLMQEEKQHSFSSFVTLTYDDSTLPIADCGRSTLVKSDVQKFFKRVRKRTLNKIKYYACGEYGPRSFRPHYHAIVFSAGTKALVESWDYGHVRIDPVNPATIAYVTGYCNKPQIRFSDDRLHEFSLMSKGLGSSYLTPEMIAYHKANMASYVTLEGGIKKGLPRYYRDKIFSDDEKLILAAAAEAKHELSIVEHEISLGWYESERRRSEAKKAGIKQQVFNLKKRNIL